MESHIFFIVKKSRLTSFRNWGRDPNTYQKIVSNNVQCFVSTYQVCINYNYSNGIGILQIQTQQFVLNLFIFIFHSDCNSVKCEAKNECVLGMFVPMPPCSVDCQVDFIWILEDQVKEKGMIKWNVELYMKKKRIFITFECI